MKRSKEPDDFDVFGLWSPRLRIKRLRVLVHEVQGTNKNPDKRPIFLDNFGLTFKDDLQGIFDYLLTDVTPILKVRPLSRRVRLALFFCHFLPYLVLAIFPLMLAIQLWAM